jgi:hypothetical protein
MVTPLTVMSFVLGNLTLGVLPPPIGEFVSSSGSGGCKFRGIIPGSLPDVNRRSTKTYTQKQIMPEQTKLRRGQKKKKITCKEKPQPIYW